MYYINCVRGTIIDFIIEILLTMLLPIYGFCRYYQDEYIFFLLLLGEEFLQGLMDLQRSFTSLR